MLGRLGPYRHPRIWVVGLHVLLAWLLFDPKPFVGGDNFWYMLLAESLRSGEGYRDLWLPNTPPHTRFPPFYPAVLAVVGLVANSPLLFKLVSMACTAGIALLVYQLAELHTRDRSIALLAGFTAASVPALVEYSHWVLSEPLFVLLVALALYRVSRDDLEPDRTSFGVGLAAALAASLTRSAGYPLLAAIGVHLLLRRRWKRFAVFVTASVVVVGGWWLRNRVTASGDLPYTEWLLFRDPYQPELGMATLPELATRFFDNLRLYTLLILPESLGGRDLGAVVSWPAGIAMATAAGAVALHRLRRMEAPEIFFALYLGVVLLWPSAWADQRLLLPLLPLAIVYLFEALRFVARIVSDEGRRPLVLYGGGAAILLLALFANLRILGRELYCAQQYWGGYEFACYPPTFADFLVAGLWMRENTEPDAIVVNRKPQMFYWYSHRRGDVYPYSEDPDTLISFLDSLDARYVVVDSWSTTTYEFLLPALEPSLEKFTVVHMRGDPSTFVLRYEREGEVSEP